jgi:16S rRNA processing protein RimM
MDREPIDIGVVAGAHGLGGDVVLHLFNPASDLPTSGMRIALRDAGGARVAMRVMTTRAASKGLCVHLEGIDDRTAAESLRGRVVEVDPDALPPLDAGEFYYRDVIGAPVTLADGTPFGRVADIFRAATDILAVRTTGGGELLVPVVEGFVLALGPEGVVIDPTGLETD